MRAANHCHSQMQASTGCCDERLHHLPSYAGATRDASRAETGRCGSVLGAGSTRAAQPLSRFRMKEESVIEKNVSLPHIRRLAMEAGFLAYAHRAAEVCGDHVVDYAERAPTGTPLVPCGTRRCALVRASMRDCPAQRGGARGRARAAGGATDWPVARATKLRTCNAGYPCGLAFVDRIAVVNTEA